MVPLTQKGMLALRASLFLATIFISFQTHATSVILQHNDLARTGANLEETNLTTANVNANSFGKLFSDAVDGNVYAQPLYLENLAIAGGVHNVVFVCTENNSVYAFNADTAGVIYWQTNLGAPYPSPCYVMKPNIGITGTPAIDTNSGTMYLDTRLKAGSLHELHALDLATGEEKFGAPVFVEAPNFDTTVQHQRPGLVLLNGVVYISYGSTCDNGDYHGFILGYNATNLALMYTFNDTATGTEAGIWSGGMAPAVDADGNIYVMSGNGSFDGINNFGESFIKLSPDLTVEDYATPTNWASMNTYDTDLGSGAPVLIPPHYVTGIGKDGTIYLADANNLGHVGNFITVISSGARGDTVGKSPVYWQGPDKQYLFFAHGNNPTLAYEFTGTNIVSQPLGKGAIVMNNNCGGISLSANGSENGILWEVGNDSVLRAYDAAKFPKLLWSGPLETTYMKMNCPTIANGKVYLGTANNLTVFGLGSNAKPPTLTIKSPKSGASWNNNPTLNITGTVKQTIPIGGVFVSVNDGGWTNAVTENGWTNWDANVELIPGVNIISAYAMDGYGGFSHTNSIKVLYKLTTTVAVSVDGNGTISPQYSGRQLVIGNNYSLTAKAGKESAFSSWNDGGDNVLTTNSKVSFEMTSNLMFVANFLDVGRPTVKISPPKGKVTGAVVTVKGTATDNVGVTNVWCRINNGGWQTATSTNGFKNWATTNLPVAMGVNMVQAYAADEAGNVSRTNTVKFTGVAP